jgi:uncharacterized protein
VATVLDIHPDGRAYAISDGAVRVEGLEPGEARSVQVSIGAISQVFGAGHSIGLHLSGSSCPRFVPNPGDRADLFSGNPGVKAVHTIHTGLEYPTRLTLPVIPAAS